MVEHVGASPLTTSICSLTSWVAVVNVTFFDATWVEVISSGSNARASKASMNIAITISLIPNPRSPTGERYTRLIVVT